MWTTCLMSANPPPPCTSLARQFPSVLLVSANPPPPLCALLAPKSPPPVHLVSAKPPPPPCASFNEAHGLGQTMSMQKCEMKNMR